MRLPFLLFIHSLFLVIISLYPQPAMAQDAGGNWLDIQINKSLVVELPKGTTNVSITTPDIADFNFLAAGRKIQIIGKRVGTTDLILTPEKGPPQIFQVTVHQDLSDLIRRVDAIVEGEPPRVYPLNDHIVVQGPVDDLNTLEQVAMVAKVYDDDFVNLMSVRGDHQVQLEVVFAEVSRTALRELGINIWAFLGPLDLRVIGANSATTDYDPKGSGDDSLIPAPNPSGFKIVGNYADQVAAYISVLDDYKLSRVLAQPSLVALSGQQAQFLVGGEVPVPGAGQGGLVQIQFKEYGIKLAFVPTVLAGDVVDLRVSTTVSEPDYSVASRLTGVEVPGFATRSAETHLRLDSGMTFAMAGLLLEETQFSRAQVPLLGDIPILGTFFRYIRHQRIEKELIIFVTPRLVRPLAPGEVPAPPGTAEDNNPGDFALYLLGMERRLGSRTAKPTAAVGLER